MHQRCEVKIMKAKNERKYYIQGRNQHLMNVLEKDYYIEIGTIDMAVLNKIIKKEKVKLGELIIPHNLDNDVKGHEKTSEEQAKDIEIANENLGRLCEGIGQITSNYETDLYYQLNYLINLRLKNATSKFFITAGIVKIFDEKGCEKYAPVVLIPFEFNYKFDYDNEIDKAIFQTELVVCDDPVINTQLIKYASNICESAKVDNKKFNDYYLNHPLASAKDIDKLCIDLAKDMHTTVQPDNYLTIAFVEYPDIILDKAYMSVEGSINEMTEENIFEKYYKNINAIMPTNTLQKYVLLKANDGDRFAVDGNLGSGKTHTIINIMADQIMKNKKILYVNQDLDNIFDLEKNLCALGMKNYLYDLTQNLLNVDNNLERLLGDKVTFERIDTKGISNTIIKDIFVLPNTLQKRLHGFKINNIFNYLALIKQKYPDVYQMPLEIKLEYHEAELIYHQLETIEESLKVIDLYADNIWHRLQVSHNNITIDDIISRIKDLALIHKKTNDALKKFINKYGIMMPSNINELYKIILHIYSFVSVRPLPKWKKDEVRRKILTNLREIQSLVDINYNINKYYESTVCKNYQIGRMKEIVDTIASKYIKIDKDYQTKNAIFINRLISYGDSLSRLCNEINDNVLKMDKISATLSNIFNPTILDENTYNFITGLSNLLSNNKLDIILFEKYQDSSALFTKHCDNILNVYDEYQEVREFLLTYLNHFELLTTDLIDSASKRKNPKHSFGAFLNKKAIKQNHTNLQDIIDNIYKYGKLRKNISSELAIIFNKKEFSEEFISVFVQFANFIADLSNVQKTYFEAFLNKMSNEKNHLQYLRQVNQILKDCKEEGYRTTSICTNLRYYNIIIDDNNVFNKVSSLKTCRKYLQNIDKLKTEISTIFNNSQHVQYDEMVTLIKTDLQYQDLQDNLINHADTYKQNLGKYYNGLDTIINEIGRTIEHYDEFLKVLINKDNINNLLTDETFDELLEEAKDLNNLYDKWNECYRKFAVCFKGSQPDFLTNSFDANTKLFKQFIDKSNQIEPILTINELTQNFLEFGFKNLFDCIRSCKYGIGVSKSFIYSILLEYEKEALEKYPILNNINEGLEIISDYKRYELGYCQNNLDKLKSRSNALKKNNVNFSNLKFNEYNKIIDLSIKHLNTSLFLSDLNIFNSNLNLEPFDLVIIDDAHLSSSNKYSRISECKQVIVFGSRSFKSSVSNSLMKRLGEPCTINFNRRYVLANSKFNNLWTKNNQYIYSYDNQYNIVMSDNFDDFINDILETFKKKPEHIINILVAKEETRRLIYTAMVEKLADYFSPVEIIEFLCYKIRILNALTECNRYVNDVFVYFDDFKDLEDSVKELVFRNFLVVHSGASIYFMKNKIEAQNTKIKQMIRKSMGKIINDDQEETEIVRLFKEELSKHNLEVENGFGRFDLIIRKRKPIGIIILGQENEDLNTFIDDYIYYHDEYSKRGWKIEYVYMLDLFNDFNKVVNEFTNEEK